MLGGGVFVTQNKTLPGSYINFVNASKATSAVGERGVVAIALPLNKAPGTVIELTRADFVKDCENILGKEYYSDDVVALREIFCHANKVYIYDLGSDKTVANAIAAFEPYSFNILCAYTSTESEIKEYCTAVINWRDNMGKKCQLVVGSDNKSIAGSITRHEGVIVVVGLVSNKNEGGHALAAWVAGAEAGCALNESCTNMLYDGEYTVYATGTQEELEEAITSGAIVFHLVYGEVRLLEDINTLTDTTVDKGEDFKSNQTIRIIDQIANDIAKLFNTKYLGKIPNNDAGRVSLWADIVKHHKELESIQAIENFDATLLTVDAGSSKKSVVVNDVITVVNAMGQLYMTVVVQ